ncbi:MAG: SMC-Scp complex subunit ScpB [Lachnospiraceae bacterium]|jgi:segregation and condensation protein B|nr:SMC-Scp complex subunit ScpB [Lachnospiraceae bacterium]
MDDKKVIQGKVEGILFAMGESVSIKEIAAALEIEEKDLLEVIDNMKEDYADPSRGIQLVTLEDSIQLRTKDDYYDDLIKIATAPKKNVLTDSVLETLSIIAYKQPVTRADVEKIRGVNSDFGINKLLEYGLIKELGRLDAPGKPLLFGTSEQFLRAFNVDSIEDLPQLSSDMINDFRSQAESELNYVKEEEPTNVDI